MANIHFICENCSENFDLPSDPGDKRVFCPRCGHPDVQQTMYCSLVPVPPPWEFECLNCQSHFSVQSPSGPDEVKSLRCPFCQSKQLKWLALAPAACGSGG